MNVMAGNSNTWDGGAEMDGWERRSFRMLPVFVIVIIVIVDDSPNVNGKSTASGNKPGRRQRFLTCAEVSPVGIVAWH